MNVLRTINAKKGQHEAFNAFKKFTDKQTDALIVAAAMKYFGMKNYAGEHVSVTFLFLRIRTAIFLRTMPTIALEALEQLLAVDENECKWNVFPKRVILTDESLNTDKLAGDFHRREESLTEEYEDVIARHMETDRPLTNKNKIYHTLVTDLYDWAYQKSWTFCRRYFAWHRNTMEASYKTRMNKHFEHCTCHPVDITCRILMILKKGSPSVTRNVCKSSKFTRVLIAVRNTDIVSEQGHQCMGGLTAT